jgi:beta-alanine degradation protein BauB
MRRASAAFAAVLLVTPPLAAQETSTPPRRTNLPDALTAGWKDQKTCENLHEDAHIRVLRCTFPPNVGHDRHFHPPSFGYVLSGGRMRVTDAKGTQEFDDKEGDHWTNGPIEWHEALNVGDTMLSYLVVEMKY